MSWIDEELRDIPLPDQRLSKRARLLLERFYADPQASINTACQGCDESDAAYRFFKHEQVTAKRILQPHQRATVQRMAQQPVALLVQDTTEQDYTPHPPQGSGPLSSPHQRGILNHTHLALTPQGLCLGVVGVDWFVRRDEDFGRSDQRRHDPIETKESYRWLQGYRRACRIAEQTPDTHVISVADSECDLYEVLVEAQQGKAAVQADYVIRASKDRSLPEKDPQGGPRTYLKLRDQMNQAALITQRQLQLPRTPKRAARQATLHVRAQCVQVKAPYRRGQKLPDLWLNVVLVQEVDAPSNVEPIEWLLITSLPIDSVEEVLQVIDYYVGRWPIEIFFRVYKTGCKVEEIQLTRLERQLPALALYKIVAWRILYATMLGRVCPELPCEVLFAPEEWMPVWQIVQQQPLPAQPPTVAEFLVMLATLGGYNNRSSDPPPGPQALWVGIRRMTDFALAWKTFGPQQHQTAPG